MTESQVTEIVRALWSIEHEIKVLNKTRKQKAILQDWETVLLKIAKPYEEQITKTLLQTRALVEAFNMLDPVEVAENMDEDFLVAYKTVECSILALETGNY